MKPHHDRTGCPALRMIDVELEPLDGISVGLGCVADVVLLAVGLCPHAC